MPIFEYRCDECGNKFDIFFRRIEEAEQSEIRCGKCGSAKVRKLFPVVGLGSEDQVSGGQCAPRSR
jgi:putative FmdB family regulatory protein